MPFEETSVTRVMQSDKVSIYRIILPSLAFAAKDSEVDSSGQKSLPFLEGFRDFLTPWLIRTTDYDAVVDVGPKATVPALARSLHSLGVSPDETRNLFVFLTHIHIDHAGGVGDFLERFPRAKVIVHPSGIPHLVNPERLWEGSVKTLGQLAYAYGPIKSTPRESVSYLPADLPANVKVIPTPGHASHHQSYLLTNDEARILFMGEAGGVYLSRYHYLRPATPPRLFYDTFVQSLKTLIQSEPSLFCYGHFGYSEDVRVLSYELDQLSFWRDHIQGFMLREPARALREPLSDEPNLAAAISESLSAQDPWLKEFSSMPEDIARRERYFLENSIRGFLGSIRGERA